ncbi:MAG: hypothetical protein ACFFE8_17515 [Candidatus Heimdallarchaeota archaeon]
MFLATFGEQGTAVATFGCWFPSNWTSNIPIPIECFASFSSNTSRTTYFRLDIAADFFTPNKTLIYHDKIAILIINSTSYGGWLDLGFFNRTWDLSITKTGISLGKQWKGVAYLIGTLSLGTESINNTSNSWNITYTGTPSKPTGFVNLPLIFLGAMTTITVILRKKT